MTSTRRADYRSDVTVRQDPVSLAFHAPPGRSASRFELPLADRGTACRDRSGSGHDVILSVPRRFARSVPSATPRASPVPDGFSSTLAEYRAWLVDAVAAIGTPVDIVGHDSGSTTIAAVMQRPDLFRSCVSDSAGVFEPDYTWHDLARAWQTPIVGEDTIAQWTAGDLEERLAFARSLGASGAVAAALARGLTPDLDRAVLGFYRSAAQPAMANLGRDLTGAARVPGMIVIADDDHFVGTTTMRERAARRAGAVTAHITNAGHRWMLDQPKATASALEQFWSTRAE